MAHKQPKIMRTISVSGSDLPYNMDAETVYYYAKLNPIDGHYDLFKREMMHLSLSTLKHDSMIDPTLSLEDAKKRLEYHEQKMLHSSFNKQAEKTGATTKQRRSVLSQQIEKAADKKKRWTRKHWSKYTPNVPGN